jgi:hypothetical protein
MVNVRNQGYVNTWQIWFVDDLPVVLLITRCCIMGCETIFSSQSAKAITRSPPTISMAMREAQINAQVRYIEIE